MLSSTQRFERIVYGSGPLIRRGRTNIPSLRQIITNDNTTRPPAHWGWATYYIIGFLIIPWFLSNLISSELGYFCLFLLLVFVPDWPCHRIPLLLDPTYLENMDTGTPFNIRWWTQDFAWKSSWRW